jgi:hypothetical protein
MGKDNKEIQFKIDGLIKLNTVGDYLKLVDKTVKLIFRKKNPTLNTKKIFKADVVDLSEIGTHLILKNVHIKKYIFFSIHLKKAVIPIDNILTIQILGK